MISLDVTLDALLTCSLAIAALGLVMCVANLRRYRPPPASPGPADALVTVCVPARNEAANLEPCVRSLLSQTHRALEVLVYDDESTDETPQILERLGAGDARVRRVATVPLPAGWNGKQFGCDRMGRAATGEWLLFTDADVRFEPTCVGRTLAEAVRPRNGPKCALISTFPRQIVGSPGEALVVPLIHFILLSYLPLGRMRKRLDPGTSAGCGQFLLVRRAVWMECGGHGAFRASMHDGIQLPRVLRRNGHGTDLFDGTALVSCRMYRGFAATWRGFSKNAFEGLGGVTLLVVISLLHLIGHVLPWTVLGWWAVAAAGGALHDAAWRGPSSVQLWLGAAAAAAAFTVRLLLCVRFRQSWLSALLHPVGILLMTAIQWESLRLHVTGNRRWKDRMAATGHTTG